MIKIYQTLSRMLENWAVFSLMEIIPVINLEFFITPRKGKSKPKRPNFTA